MGASDVLPTAFWRERPADAGPATPAAARRDARRRACPRKGVGEASSEFRQAVGVIKQGLPAMEPRYPKPAACTDHSIFGTR